MVWSEPIAGIHPLVWIAIFVLVGPPAIASKTASKIPGILGTVGRWWQQRAEMTTSERVSRAEIDRILADYERVLARLNALKERLDEMEVSLTEANRLMWAAAGHARQLRNILTNHAPEALPPVPDKLKDLI